MRQNHPRKTLSPSRRSFFGLLGAGAGAAALTSCGDSSSGDSSAASGSSEYLPTYKELEIVEPDYPAVNGSTPGFLTIPAELQETYPDPIGDGSEATAMVPLWSAIPDLSGNSYIDALRAKTGYDFAFQMTEGSSYGDKLATVLASPDNVPDWVAMPAWNIRSNFHQAIEGVFQDLSPYLGGDAVLDYPHLANLPTSSWQFSSFGQKLYGLPKPGGVVTNALFTRGDLLDEMGITPEITDGQELIDLAVELTDAKTNRWGANDLGVLAYLIFHVPEKWKLDDSGKLINRVETEEFKQALDWLKKLFDSGAVHPDAVAGNVAAAKQRFESGNVLLTVDGLGGWAEAYNRQRPSNPEYRQDAVKWFSGDGGDPWVYVNRPAEMVTFIKRTDDEEKIKNFLRVADLLASPFGTTEYQLIERGVEGEHFTLADSGEEMPTELGQSEVITTFRSLCAPPQTNAIVSMPDYVEAFCTWQADAAKNAVEPPLHGVQIAEPPQLAQLSQPFSDLQADVPRGRQSLADVDAAVEEWRKNGGEELRALYQEALDSGNY